MLEPSEAGHQLLTRRGLLLGGTAFLTVGAVTLASVPASALEPGSATATLSYAGAFDLLAAKAWGAGWPQCTLEYFITITRWGDYYWSESRTKYSATSFNWSEGFNCGDGLYQMSLDVYGQPWGLYNHDDAVVWA